MIDPKWTGTDFDRRDMRTLNIEQVVRVSALLSPKICTNCWQRNFGKLAMFGFASTVLCTWEVIAMYVSLHRLAAAF
jgi:hypothetical protein